MANSELLKRLRQKQAELSEIPFIILVWGPAVDAETEAAVKRRAIREALAEGFGAENVIFSEDPDPALEQFREEVGDYTAEFLEASVADAVIIVAESIGSITEAALYRELLAGKTLVFVKRRPEEQQGFASQAYSRLKVEPIEPEEWQSCGRARRKARYFAEELRIEKYQRTKT